MARSLSRRPKNVKSPMFKLEQLEDRTTPASPYFGSDTMTGAIFDVNTNPNLMTFQVTDSDRNFSDMRFSIISSNYRLLPKDGLSYEITGISGNTATYNVQFLPTPGQTGQAEFSLFVDDDDNLANNNGGQTRYVGVFTVRGYASDVPRPDQISYVDTSGYTIPGGQVLYVAANGSPTSNASVGSPATIARAFSLAQPGATIVFRDTGGPYTGTVTLPYNKPNLTLMAYPGEHPVIKGAVTVPGANWTSTGSGTWYMSTADPDGPENRNAATGLIQYEFPQDVEVQIESLNNTTNPFGLNREQVFINNVPMWQVGLYRKAVSGSTETFYRTADNVWIATRTNGVFSYNPSVPNAATVFADITNVAANTALLNGSKFFVDYLSNRIYVAQNPTTNTVDVTAYRIGLNNFFRATSQNDTYTVRGLNFVQFADYGVRTGGSRLVLEDTTLAWNANNGLQADGQNEDGRGTLIRGNQAIANGETGFGINSDNSEILNNIARYNNVQKLSTGWGAAGIKVYRTSDTLIRGNVVEDNYATGIWIDIDMFDNVIVQNVVRRNETGIFVEISHRNYVGFNVVTDNIDHGIRLHNTSDTFVFNNTVVNNGYAIHLYDYPRVGEDPSPGEPLFDLGSTWGVYGNVVMNNLLIGSDQGPLVDARNTNPTPVPSINDGGVLEYLPRTSYSMLESVDYNNYYDATSPVFVGWDTSDDGSHGNLTYATLAAFRGAAVANQKYEANGKSLDPQFVGTGATVWDQYALQPTSNVIGTVAAVPSAILNAVGLSQPNYMGAVAPIGPPPNSPPTNVTLSNATVAENTGGAAGVVGTFSATDPDGDTLTYALPDASNNWRFEIVNGNQLRVRAAYPIDFETNPTQYVKVLVSDGVNPAVSKDFLITVADVNEAPTAITVSPGQVAENLAAGATVGTLGVTGDPDKTPQTYTYALVGGAVDNTAFDIVDGTLVTKQGFDYEAKSSYTVRVQVTNPGTPTVTLTRDLTVTVTNANDAPVAVADTLAVNEDGSATVNVLANDTDQDGHTLSVTSFTQGTNGAVSFAGGVATYTPAANFNGTDSFTYTVSDGNGGTAVGTVTVTVAPVNDAPGNLALSNATVVENAGGAAGVVGTLSATDPDGDTLTYSLPDGKSNNWRFEIVNGNQLRVRAAYPIDYESNPFQWVTVWASDGVAPPTEKAFRIDVRNVAEAASTTVNDGNQQRSVVKSVTLAFDAPVVIDANAFTVTRESDGATATVTVVTQLIDGRTVATLTFAGPNTEFGSLADGVWTLAAAPNAIRDAGTNANVFAGGYSSSFHRLFGDADGDRDVDAADYTAFRVAYGSASGGGKYVAHLDFNGDGVVNGTDQTAIRARYGKSI